MKERGQYSFWASMMIRALSEVEAVDGGAPTSSRNPFAISITTNINESALQYCPSSVQRVSVSQQFSLKKER